MVHKMRLEQEQNMVHELRLEQVHINYLTYASNETKHDQLVIHNNMNFKE